MAGAGHAAPRWRVPRRTAKLRFQWDTPARYLLDYSWHCWLPHSSPDHSQRCTRAASQPLNNQAKPSGLVMDGRRWWSMGYRSAKEAAIIA